MNDGSSSPGTLFVVGTPIGNLDDLSPRVRDVLANVHTIACEDTRRTGRLFELAGIANEGESRPPFVSMNGDNEQSRLAVLVRLLLDGNDVAVVSDAGMPTVADPGALLVDAAHSNAITVVAIPGPSSVTCALAASGFPSDRFVFEGFPPRKGVARTAVLSTLRYERRTVVFFESPNRVGRLLTDLAAELGGDREAAVCRELTKMHETTKRGSLDNLVVTFSGDDVPPGEYVVVVAGFAGVVEVTDDELLVALAAEKGLGVAPSKAAASVAKMFGVTRARVYELERNAST